MTAATTEALVQKPKKIDDAAMDALVKKLCEEHGAEAVELRIEMPTGKDDHYDEFVFRYGFDHVGDEPEEEAEDLSGPAETTT